MLQKVTDDYSKKIEEFAAAKEKRSSSAEALSRDKRFSRLSQFSIKTLLSSTGLESVDRHGFSCRRRFYRMRPRGLNVREEVPDDRARIKLEGKADCLLID
jgi:hypothetical protein